MTQLDFAITAEQAYEIAASQKVCVRPMVRRVLDRQTGAEEVVAIACGSTRETVCPSCAHKARVLRMQQCADGWHRDTEPEPADADRPVDHEEDDDQDEKVEGSARRVRSTRRRQDVPDLPRLPMANRTVRRTFTSPDGKQYRPSMFLTLTLPSYGPIVPGRGNPADPDRYDYRRAALDALLFPRLVDRFWQNLRRCAGYRVQYFAAVEPQHRAAPHLHTAMRGAIARQILRQVVKATYVNVWWPPCDRPVYVHRQPVWTGEGYCDPDTGEMLPAWTEALDQLDADPDARPAHVLRFGSQLDMAGIIAPSVDADRSVRYLCKYLTKTIAGAHTDPDTEPDPDYTNHLDRLHQEVRWLPCSPRCANWLRYGVTPQDPGPGLVPGRCSSPAHDRDNLGCGGRRVLVSRDWSGKTLGQHKADRAAVVRETLLSAGINGPDLDRLAASVTLADGSPRFVWTDTRPNAETYTRLILHAVSERLRWRAQYDHAKTAAAAEAVDSHSATAEPP